MMLRTAAYVFLFSGLLSHACTSSLSCDHIVSPCGFPGGVRAAVAMTAGIPF